MSFFGGRRKDPWDEDPAPGRASGWEPAPARPDAVHDDRNLEPGGRGRARPETRTGEDMANIGKSISIKGDLTGNEDLVIEGTVEGKIELPSNELTIGSNGHVTAQVHAKSVVVVGRIKGDVSASERVEVQSSGVVDGDVRAPRLAIEEGAVVNGSIEMSSKSTASTSAAPRPLAASSSSGSSGGAPPEKKQAVS